MLSISEGLLDVKCDTSLIHVPEKVGEVLWSSEQTVVATSDLIIYRTSEDEVPFGFHLLCMA